MRSFEVGSRTEAVVLSALAKAGYTVLVPFGVARYDLAVDDRTGAGIKTVQCKTGRLRYGCVIFNTCSQDRGTKVRTSYRGQVDYFGVCCPGTEDIYLVPVDKVGAMEGCLRIDPVKNNQRTSVRWANDFVIKDLP
jgi:hypothetical protein